MVGNKLHTKKDQTGDDFATVEDFIARHQDRFVYPLQPWRTPAQPAAEVQSSVTGGYDRVGSASAQLEISTSLQVGGAYDSMSRDMAHACWGKLGKAEALQMIVGKPAGTYVPLPVTCRVINCPAIVLPFDSCTAVPMPHSYFTRISEQDGLSVIVFVDAQGTIGQAKVFKVNGADGLEMFTTQSDPERRTKNELHESLGLLLARSKIFDIPHPPPREC
jgi:hypothetical protein